MLGTADVDGHILCLRADPHDHAAVDLGAGCDEHGTALLRVPDAVGHGLARFKGDERAGIAPGDLALVGFVSFKDGSQDAFPLGVGEEFVAVAEQAAGGYEKLHLHAVPDRGHLKELALARAELFHDRAHIVLRDIDHDALHRFTQLAVNRLVQDARRGNLEFIALAPHGLDED